MVHFIVAALLLNGDWPTFGADPQRTSWNKSETALTRRNVGNLVLRWKATVNNQTRELNALTAPLVAGDLVIVGGSADMIEALDAAGGQPKWTRKFAVDNTRRPKDPSWLCPSAQNATPLVDKNTIFAIASDGKLHALNLNDGAERMPPTQFTPPFSKNWSLNIHGGVLYTTTSQCCGGGQSGVWMMDLSAPDHRVTFVPSSTAHPTPGAGGVAGVWGRAGVAIGKNRVFAETGDGQYDSAAGKLPDTVLAISIPGNKLVDYYTPANRAFLSSKDLDLGSMSPVVFTYRSRELVAAAGKEGVIYLLDAASIGGTDHRTPLYRSPVLSNAAADFVGHGFWGAFATWKDPAGARWLFAPSLGPPSAQALTAFKSRRHGDAPHGSIMAFKVTGAKAAPRLVPMWMSGDMSIPDPPIVANGVVFAVSTGEFTGATAKSGAMFTSAEKIKQHTSNAVLYAFDALTGRELFSSGNTMSSFTHFSGIAVSGGRVFVSTFDNTLYAFGLKQ